MEDTYLKSLREIESNYVSALIKLESLAEKPEDTKALTMLQQALVQVRRQIRGYQEQGAEIGQLP